MFFSVDKHKKRPAEAGRKVMLLVSLCSPVVEVSKVYEQIKCGAPSLISIHRKMQTDVLITTAKNAHSYAVEGTLKTALESNATPLQATFAKLISSWVQFTKEYLVDSLLATEVVFSSKGQSLKSA